MSPPCSSTAISIFLIKCSISESYMRVRRASFSEGGTRWQETGRAGSQAAGCQSGPAARPRRRGHVAGSTWPARFGSLTRCDETCNAALVLCCVMCPESLAMSDSNCTRVLSKLFTPRSVGLSKADVAEHFGKDALHRNAMTRRHTTLAERLLQAGCSLREPRRNEGHP